MKLESLVKNGKKFVTAGLVFLMMGCASSRFYLEPKIGLITPIGEKQNYPSSATFGTASGIAGKNTGLELGLNYFHSSGKYIKTDHYLWNINLNLNLSKDSAKTKLYLIGGGSILNESSIIKIPKFEVHDEMKNMTPGLEFGAGITLIDRIDARVGYMIMLGSENVKGMLMLSAGYRLLF